MEENQHFKEAEQLNKKTHKTKEKETNTKNNSFEVHNWSLEGISKYKMTFKNIMRSSAVILA